MNDIPTIAFIGLPLLTGCIGVGLGYALRGVESYEPKDPTSILVNAAADSYRRSKYLAATKANQELSNSNARLASQNDALKTRLNRIVEAFADQRSGTAKKAVKLALGDA